MAISPDVVLYSLIPAVMWGLSPTFTKRGIVRGGSSLQASVVVVAVGVICYGVGLAFVGRLTSLGTLSPTVWLVFTGSGIAGAVAWLASYTGVDKVGASVNSAIFNSHPLFATVIALFSLGEALSPQTAVGIMVLVIGLLLVADSKGGNRGGWARSYLVFPIIASGAYAISNVVRRYGLTMTSVTTLEAITINAVVTFVILILYGSVRRETSILPPSFDAFRAFAISGFLSAVALFFLFEAFARGPVAIVSALSGLSPVIATLVTAVMLSDVEKVTRRVIAGACLVVVGAALISLA